MGKMSLVQALQIKNQLGKRLEEVRIEIDQANRFVKGNPIDTSVDACLTIEGMLLDKVIELRTKINEANGPVREEIVRLAELRGRGMFLRSIPTERGVPSSPRRFSSDGNPVEYDTQIEKGVIIDLVRQNEKEISKIQDALAAHNASTEIDIEISDSLRFG